METIPCRNENTLVIGTYGCGGTQILTDAIKKGEGSFMITAPDTCRFPVFAHFQSSGYSTCIIHSGRNESNPVSDISWLCRGDKQALFIETKQDREGAKYVNRLCGALRDLKSCNESPLTIVMDDMAGNIPNLYPLMKEANSLQISIMIAAHSMGQLWGIFRKDWDKAMDQFGNIISLRVSDLETAKMIIKRTKADIAPAELTHLRMGEAIVYDGNKAELKQFAPGAA